MEDKDKDNEKNKENVNTVTDDSSVLVDKALKTFCCYLYVGKGHPYYKARPWNDDESYPMSERLRSLEILAANKKTELVPIDKIKLAMDSTLIRRPETLMFALAMCARQKKSEKLRAAAYYFLAEHCKKWEYFILFIKYASILCKMQGSTEKEGTGKEERSTEIKITGQIKEPHEKEETGLIKEPHEKEETGKIKEPHEKEETGKIEGSTEKEKTGKIEGSAEKEGTCQHIGWGHGWKNAVNKWYLTQSARELSQLVTFNKGNHGWKHKDILKLSHPDTMGLEVEKRAIMCYVIRGIEKAEMEYNNDPEARKILEYIRSVEFFKKCENPAAVAGLIPAGRFTIDQVHPKALKSKGVWNALLVNMDVRTILKYLPKMNELGLLTKVSPATQLVVRSLTDESNLRWNKILPGDILAVLTRYERRPTHEWQTFDRLPQDIQDMIGKEAWIKMKSESSRPKKQTVAPSAKTNRSQTNAKSKISEKTAKRPAARTVKDPDMRILDALRTALAIAQTVDITSSSKLTYLVSVRLPGRHNNICAEAGLAIALPLMHREDLPESAVTIVGYEPSMCCGSLIDVTKEMCFDEALDLLITKKSKYINHLHMPLGPLGWAYKQRKKYDVFINVTNEPPTKDILEIMAFYRQNSNLPDARLINVIINQAPFELKGDVWHDALTINGNDPHVPWIIEAYVRGLF